MDQRIQNSLSQDKCAACEPRDCILRPPSQETAEGGFMLLQFIRNLPSDCILSIS